jgi:hypothetical protein
MAPVVSSSGGVSPGQPSDDTIFGLPRWAVLAATGGVLVAGVAYYILKDPAPKKKGKPWQCRPYHTTLVSILLFFWKR